MLRFAKTASVWQTAPRRPESAVRWMAFLNNHREAIAEMDFLTVPTLTFGMLTASSSFLMTRSQGRVDQLSFEILYGYFGAVDSEASSVFACISMGWDASAWAQRLRKDL
jgi:hypothetical protein